MNQVGHEKNTYSKNFPIKYYEMDYRKGLKPSALLNFLQDMATENAEMLGFGASYTFPRNMGWFLVKYHMEFDEYPIDMDEIVISTEARGFSRLIATRDFEIHSAGGQRLGRITSNWMLVDLESKNLLQVGKVFPFVSPFEKRASDLSFEKIKTIENVSYEKRFQIRFDDIDVNQHVNNCNYIVWAFEALPYEFNSTHKLKTLDVVFKKEVSYGSDIISQVEFDEQNKLTMHLIKNISTGDDLCTVRAQWVAV